MQYDKYTIFFDHYRDLPDDAEYVLRELSDCSVVLEEHPKGYKYQLLLKTFPVGAFSDDKFDDTLKACRKIINNSTLYVQKPIFMYSEEEFESLFFKSTNDTDFYGDDNFLIKN